MSAIGREDISGIVLSGGRGTRMGGVDKGLQTYRGVPMALYTLLRLQPQVGAAMINANRNLAAYEAMGVPVWPDTRPEFPGPLAGMLAGLEHCETPWLLTVPCDSPNFPDDLALRLAQAASAQDAEVAMAATPAPDGTLQPQPVFCLLSAQLLESLEAAMQAGERKIDRWTARHRCAVVPFDDPAAFANANTLDELQRLQTPTPRGARDRHHD